MLEESNKESMSKLKGTSIISCSTCMEKISGLSLIYLHPKLYFISKEMEFWELEQRLK